MTNRGKFEQKEKIKMKTGTRAKLLQKCMKFRLWVREVKWGGGKLF